MQSIMDNPIEDTQFPHLDIGVEAGNPDTFSIRSVGASLSILLILSFAGFTPGCLDDEGLNAPYVKYYAFVNASGPIQVIMPAPVLSQLEERIALENGQGDIAIVETDLGRCLKFSTSRKMEASGLWKPRDDSERALMTINLTTMVPNETAPYYFNNKTMPDRHVGIHIDSARNGSIALSIRMTRANGPFYAFTFSAALDDLVVGWNIVMMDGSYYREYT